MLKKYMYSKKNVISSTLYTKDFTFRRDVLHLLTIK